MNTLETVGKVSKPFGREGELIINLYDTFPEEFDKRNRSSHLSMRWRFLFLSRNSSDAAAAAHSLHSRISTRRNGPRNLSVWNSPCARTMRRRTTTSSIWRIWSASGRRSTVIRFGEKSRTISTANRTRCSPITAEGREILVPAAEEMISALDIDAREITFVLPEGLLDLYL